MKKLIVKKKVNGVNQTHKRIDNEEALKKALHYRDCGLEGYSDSKRIAKRLTHLLSEMSKVLNETFNYSEEAIKGGRVEADNSHLSEIKYLVANFENACKSSVILLKKIPEEAEHFIRYSKEVNGDSSRHRTDRAGNYQTTNTVSKTIKRIRTDKGEVREFIDKGILYVQQISDEALKIEKTSKDLKNKLKTLKSENSHLGDGSLFGSVPNDVKKEIGKLERDIADLEEVFRSEVKNIFVGKVS